MTLPPREELEHAVCEISGVEAARVQIENDEISEIHVAALPGRRAKNIARDVRTYLLAAKGVDVHHRKISVAQRAGEGPGDGVAEADLQPETGEAAPRVLFQSVNLLIEGLRSEAQVELRVGGRRLLGSATGVPAALGTERLIVSATLSAIEHLVRQDVRVVPGDVALVPIGTGEIIAVEVILVRPRQEERLIGACRLGPDRHRSVVFAVLDAVNRILSRLMPMRWVEFEVEPPAPQPKPRGNG